MKRPTLALLVLLALSGCAQPIVSCPEQPYVDLPEAAAYVDDDSFPFRFPMDDTATDMVEYPARFCSENWDGSTMVESWSICPRLIGVSFALC